MTERKSAWNWFKPTYSIPNDPDVFRRSTLFAARAVLRDIQIGDIDVCSTLSPVQRKGFLFPKRRVAKDGFYNPKIKRGCPSFLPCSQGPGPLTGTRSSNIVCVLLKLLFFRWLITA
ncbi:MAG: hypothetical protein P8M25_03465 [Paracoccaceae bacterium]|jgi:hypothetical protein|nr:hypothetical protein [Paracoccaceae bacterium]